MMEQNVCDGAVEGGETEPSDGPMPGNHPATRIFSVFGDRKKSS